MGFFVVFEGGEGSGKTTQMRHIVKWLEEQGFPTLYTLNPGGTQIGEEIRGLLLDPRNKRLSPRAELLLYEADRAQHVDELVLPALKDGKVVVCDRFTDSSTVYQGICRGMGEALTERLNRFATNQLVPDLVIVLDLPETVGRRRIRKRMRDDVGLSGIRRRVKLDRLERERSAFHRKVRNGYLKLARKRPSHYKVIDATLPESDVAEEIRKAVSMRLRRKKLWIPEPKSK